MRQLSLRYFSIFFLLSAFLFIGVKTIAAGCRQTTDCSGACASGVSYSCINGTCHCTTLHPSAVCGDWGTCASGGGTICYQRRVCGSSEYQIRQCTCPSTCKPNTLDCSSACGQSARCISDGCGGQSCCGATAACPKPTATPTPKPTATPTPTPNCTSRPKGDANCDTAINDVDYGMWASHLKGYANTCQYCSVDFNRDTVVNLIDYEIWRATRYN